MWQKHEGLVECLTEYLLVVIWNEWGYFRTGIPVISPSRHLPSLYTLKIWFHCIQRLSMFQAKGEQPRSYLEQVKQNGGRGWPKWRQGREQSVLNLKREMLLVWTSVVAVKMGLKNIQEVYFDSEKNLMEAVKEREEPGIIPKFLAWGTHKWRCFFWDENIGRR